MCAGPLSALSCMDSEALFIKQDDKRCDVWYINSFLKAFYEGQRLFSLHSIQIRLAAVNFRYRRALEFLLLVIVVEGLFIHVVRRNTVLCDKVPVSLVYHVVSRLKRGLKRTYFSRKVLPIMCRVRVAAIHTGTTGTVDM